MSTDPGFGTAFTVTDLNAAIDFDFPAAPVLLVQSSQNIGSAGLGGPLDVTIPGAYDFRLTVLDGDTALARTAMRVIVGQVSEPMTLSLLGSGLLLLGVQRAPAPPGLSGAIRNGGPLVAVSASMPLAPKR